MTLRSGGITLVEGTLKTEICTVKGHATDRFGKKGEM